MTSRPTPQALISDLQSRLADLLRRSPAADLDRNLRAIVGQTFQRFDLVTRDEFDAQVERVARLQQRVEALESLLAAKSDPQPSPPEASGSDTSDAVDRLATGPQIPE